MGRRTPMLPANCRGALLCCPSMPRASACGAANPICPSPPQSDAPNLQSACYNETSNRPPARSATHATTSTHRHRTLIAAAAILAACGGGSSTPTPTPTQPLPRQPPRLGANVNLVAASTSTAGAAPTSTPHRRSSTPAPSSPPSKGTPSTREPHSPSTSNTKWQLCLGGAAAGSSEKYLFRTTDGGATWKLISQTTLGNPTPQAGVGELPNGNGVVQILFLDDTNGWMGLTSPGANLYRSQDGGVTWTESPSSRRLSPSPPSPSPTRMHGTVVTPEGDWTTTDGGVTWTH